MEIYLKQPPHVSGLTQIYATKTLDYVYKGVGRVSKRWHGLRKNKKLESGWFLIPEGTEMSI